MNKLFITMCVLPVALWAQSAQVVFDTHAQLPLIAQALNQYYNAEGGLEVATLGDLKSVDKLPASIEVMEAPAKPATQMVVRLRYLDDKGAPQNSFQARLKSVWNKKAFVARRTLAKGTSVAPEDLDEQTIDRLTVRNSLVETDTKLGDYEVAQQISTGTPITWDVIKTKPLVHKGNLVDVVAADGLLQITSRAVALQDGGRGETVMMRNTASNKPFQAIVINENLVQVRF